MNAAKTQNKTRRGFQFHFGRVANNFGCAHVDVKTASVFLQLNFGIDLRKSQKCKQ